MKSFILRWLIASLLVTIGRGIATAEEIFNASSDAQSKNIRISSVAENESAKHESDEGENRITTDSILDGIIKEGRAAIPSDPACGYSTALAGCKQEGKAIVTKLVDDGVQVERKYVQEKGNGRATVIERVVSPIRVEVEVRGEGEPWSTPIETKFEFAQDQPTRFWTAWGDPRPDGKDWTNPLRAAEWQDRDFFYGGRRLKYFKEPSTFSLPMFSVLNEETDSGMSVILSPDDRVLTLKMNTTKQKTVVILRENHRLGKGDTVRFSMDIVQHPADWRCGLGWMVEHYPQYFDPPNPRAQQMAGCGSYTSNDEFGDVERYMKMSFRVNWKASFDFPYMGMFLPPVAADDEEWTDFNGNKISIAKMRDAAQTMRQKGFYLLNYFNVTEFGAKTKYPAPPRKAEKDADLWKDSNDFLHYALGEAILPGADGKPIFSWEGCVVMDPGEKVYRDFLLEQARRHVEKFPESAGIAIDRLDWIMEYNRQRDDGATWFEGKPARCVATAWHELLGPLSKIMHDAGKTIFVNTMYPRIDLMRQVDGVYDEHGQHPHSLNVSTLLALNKPYIAWTWELEDFDKNADEYFQRHLHMGAYLTAPVAGNDHTMLPDSKREQYYIDYGPLLDALRGKRWVLLPHVVRVEGDKALANIFEVPGGYVVPVTFGGAELSAKLILQNLPQREYKISAIHPALSNSDELSGDRHDNRIQIDVPLVRGCAMVLLSYAAMEPRTPYYHDRLQVRLSTTLEKTSIRYTLDGSEPTMQSPEYASPLDLEKTTVVKAAFFQEGKQIGATLEREYVKLPGK